MKEIFNNVLHFLRDPLFNLGNTHVSLGLILYIVVSVFLLFWLSGILKRLLQNRVLVRYNVDVGVRQAISIHPTNPILVQQVFINKLREQVFDLR